MQYLKKYKQKLKYLNYSKRTIDGYSSALKSFMDSVNTSPALVTTKEIISYLEDKDYTSISQQNQYIGALKLYAKYILGKKNLHLKKIQRPRKEKRIPKVMASKEVVEKINRIGNLKHKAMLSVLLSTGLRASELLNLKVSDIDSKRMVIDVRLGKRNKDRQVKLTGNILSILRDYYKVYKPKDYLFEGCNGSQYSYSSLLKVSKKYLGCTPHNLRHTYATLILENGASMYVLMDQLGHTNIKTTQIYAHLTRNMYNQLKPAI